VKSSGYTTFVASPEDELLDEVVELDAEVEELLDPPPAPDLPGPVDELEDARPPVAVVDPPTALLPAVHAPALAPMKISHPSPT
jgi:hypothetical protein